MEKEEDDDDVEIEVVAAIQMHGIMIEVKANRETSCVRISTYMMQDEKTVYDKLVYTLEEALRIFDARARGLLSGKIFLEPDIVARMFAMGEKFEAKGGESLY